MSKGPAPKPDNFEELAATWNDPVAHALEVARYNEQLRQAGLAPLYEQIDPTEERRSYEDLF